LASDEPTDRNNNNKKQQEQHKDNCHKQNGVVLSQQMEQSESNGS